ncbi:hypothetical protein TNCT_482561 [Trichonephila clavata]|uniref:Uncharacterized protein n=1 Tax=Trichonephila clavata TaxID=2740835 RepID=A0A8X6JMQ3_TRICU|nr:hypothetical protein TNCT_482561 [Trichonephila clavata]
MLLKIKVVAEGLASSISATYKYCGSSHGSITLNSVPAVVSSKFEVCLWHEMHWNWKKCSSDILCADELASSSS